MELSQKPQSNSGACGQKALLVVVHPRVLIIQGYIIRLNFETSDNKNISDLTWCYMVHASLAHEVYLDSDLPENDILSI